MKRFISRLVLPLVLISQTGFFPAAYGQVTILSEDFSAGDGGFTVVNMGSIEGPWTFGPTAGGAGDGAWFVNGSLNVGSPTSSTLTSPTLDILDSGSLKISFSHRYNFEYDGIRWDGGNVQVSINGGPFAAVGRLRFTANGYVGVITGNNIINGQFGFNNESAGYASGEFIESVAIVGDANAGDTLAVRFAGGWDEFTAGVQPNWVIDSLEVEAGGPLSGPATVVLVPFDAPWKYDESGTDLGTSWRMQAFADNSWPSGPGVLGFPASENLLGMATISTPLRRFISGNSPPQPITYYFRTTFTVDEPQGLSLVFTNLIDDGAIFYLNGNEQFRVAMPGGPVNYQTQSPRADDISNHGADVVLLDTLDLVSGENVLAVELHQGGLTSGDVILGVTVVAELPPQGTDVRPPLPLLVLGSNWRYDVSATDLGPAWSAPGFNDAGWLSGPGPLGYEPSTLPAPLQTTFNSNNELTYYFRSSFMFADDPGDAQLALTLLLDDGAVVYLNGSKCFASGWTKASSTSTPPPLARSITPAWKRSSSLPRAWSKDSTPSLSKRIKSTEPAPT